MNYIITKNKEFFNKIGDYNFCELNDMMLPNSLAVDTETTGLEVMYTDGEFLGADIFAIQIGTGENNYLIDLQDHNNGFEVEEVIPYLKDKTLVLHNSTFDLRLFYKHGFFPKKVYDTFIASKQIYNGGRDYVFTHDFGSVMSRELGIHYDKSEQKNIATVQLRTAKAIEYCFNDVDKLLELGRHLYKKIHSEGGVESYEVNCNFTRALAYMEMCGLPIDEELWLSKINKDKNDLQEITEQITEYIFENLPKYRDTQLDIFDDSKKITLNLESPKQMIPVFKDLGINVINSKGKESIKEDVINKSSHEFVEMWLKKQGIAQNLSTFGQSVLDKVKNGRIFTSFNPMVDTCRIASKRGGINFLNFPSDSTTRSCFVAKKGFKMIVCDYDGQENVVGADLHNDAMMIASINEGKDLHCAFARLLFPEIAELSDEEIKKNHKDLRSKAKAPRFAFAYGGNGYTISVNENVSLKRGQEIEKLFKELHSGVYEWGDKKLNESIENGYIESGGGWKLWLPNFDEFKERKEWLDSHDKEYWSQYKLGKIQYNKMKEFERKLEEGLEVEEYFIEDEFSYDLYRRDKRRVSEFFKLRSRYQRLCLNNPVQSISAHQTKSAIISLFDTIIDNGHQWKVKICNAPYDEIVMEVVDELSDLYRETLQSAMKDEGNKWLKSGKVFMSATAEIGESWEEAK